MTVSSYILIQNEVGKASGPEFWKRVQALGEKPYYPAPKL